MEAVEYYRKAKEIDPKKTITDCAGELGVNDKTLNDWILKYDDTGRVTQARTDERRALDDANRRIRELELENEFLKKRRPSSPETSRRGQVPPHAGGEGRLQRVHDGPRAGREPLGLLQVAQGQPARRRPLGRPQGRDTRGVGGEPQALRLPQGPRQARGRPELQRPLRRCDPLPREKVHA